MGVGDSTNTSKNDKMEKLIHHQTSIVVTTCNSKLLPFEVKLTCYVVSYFRQP